MSHEHKHSVTFTEVGQLKGHGGWVTSLATSVLQPNMLLSGSRDKSIIRWEITKKKDSYGYAKRRLTGHSHFVSDIAISSDGQFGLSGSWDGTLRLWDLNTGSTTKQFVDHTKDVLSVAFSVDNRQIVSASRDKTIKLWNTLGQCKLTIVDQGHTDWVSSVRFSPNMDNPVIVSGGWDKMVKVWGLNKCKIRTNFHGHTGYVNTVCVSPCGTLCASGGRDGQAMLWDLTHGEHMSTLDAGDIIHAMCFSPDKYWLCVAVGSAIKIWDLETKKVIATLLPKKDEKSEAGKKAIPIQCLSLAWGADETTLFAGYTDNSIHIYHASH